MCQNQRLLARLVEVESNSKYILYLFKRKKRPVLSLCRLMVRYIRNVVSTSQKFPIFEGCV